MTEYDLTGMTV